MAYHGGEKEVYFNTRTAVKDLLEGVPVTEVFGPPKFSLFLPTLDAHEIKYSRIRDNARTSSDVKKAMIGTLLTAACADIAHGLVRMDIHASIPVQRYEMDSTVIPSLVQRVFVHQFRSSILPAQRIALSHFEWGDVPSPIFDSVLQSFGNFVRGTTTEVRQATAEKMRINANTPDTLIHPFLDLIRDLFYRTNNVPPIVSQLVETLGNSTEVFHFFGERNVDFFDAAVDTIFGGRRFDRHSFELLQPPLHEVLSVRVKPNSRPVIQSNYHNRDCKIDPDKQFVTTGCPANPMLIDVLIQRFIDIIKASAGSIEKRSGASWLLF